MQRYFGLIALCAFAFSLASCETDASIENDGAAGGFAITRLEYDSLYPGELGVLYGRGLGVSAENAKLFVGSIPITILSAEENLVRFMLPTDCISGWLRYYKGEEQADGEVHLEIVQRTDHGDARIDGFVPERGFVGETFVVYGDRLDLRVRDVKIRIGNTQLKVDRTSKFAVYSTVPAGVKEDSVVVSVPGRTRSLGIFHLSQQGSAKQFLSSQFSRVTLSVSIPVICTRIINGVRVNETRKFTAFDTIAHSTQQAVNANGSILQYSGEQFGPDDTTMFDIKFGEYSGDRLSGSLIVRSSRRGNMFGVSVLNQTEMRFALDGAICRTSNGHTDILASVFKDPKAIELTSYRSTDSFDNGSSDGFELQELDSMAEGAEPSFIALRFEK